MVKRHLGKSMSLQYPELTMTTDSFALTVNKKPSGFLSFTSSYQVLSSDEANGGNVITVRRV